MLYGNRRLGNMLGTLEQRVVGQHLQTFLLPADATRLAQMLVEAKHVDVRDELTICSAQGIQVPASISMHLLQSQAATMQFYGVLTDLTVQKNYLREMGEAMADLVDLTADLRRARDVAEQANRAKTRFLAKVSHELRTPLNGILGYAQLLRLDEELNTAHLAKIDAMMDAGTHLLHMINGVLDLSEIEAEHVELRITRVELYSVARACLDLVRPTAAAKRIALALVIAPDAPTHVMTDPTRLRQVLFNLLGNAVKFTARGSVELRLTLTADGVHLRIEVTDTGPGVAPYQRPRLFREFERLSTDASVAIEGAGLGLVLSARIAELIGGRIGYQDNPGGGSVFWLELPVGVSVGGAPLRGWIAAPDAPDAPAAPTPAHRLRVLVADDVAMSRDIASSFLRLAGHRVVCVEGGREAVAAITAADFDIVLMDVRMPEMDGLEATRRVRALNGPRGRVPIVALTAHAFSGQVQECRTAGMDGHLVKPLMLALLLDTVARVAAVRRPIKQGAIPIINPATRPGDPALGLELPVLDPAVFEATAALLAPVAVASYLRTLVDQAETFVRALVALDAIPLTAGVLAQAAHRLAGGAGMFGFKRLAAAGRCFEHAVQNTPAEAPALALTLSAAAQTALGEMRRLLVAVKD